MKRIRNDDKGFSLVELIVVIVILAILIGVTIGGIYQYVNKARINTDIHNAQEIKTALGVDFINGDFFNSPKFVIPFKKMVVICLLQKQIYL